MRSATDEDRLENIMHGEFKTPGGKLVRVEFDVRDGGLRDVVVSGDFFLYPDEALSDITGSLDGVSPDLSETDLATHIAAAIPPGTEWLGSSPEALAVAVRRALSENEATNV
jgi:lipoate-protein ligase A